MTIPSRQFAALLLVRGGVSSVRDLAREMGIKFQSAQRHLERLAIRGLVVLKYGQWAAAEGGTRPSNVVLSPAVELLSDVDRLLGRLHLTNGQRHEVEAMRARIAGMVGG